MDEGFPTLISSAPYPDSAAPTVAVPNLAPDSYKDLAPTEHELRLQLRLRRCRWAGEADGTVSVSGVVDGLGEAVGTVSVSGVIDGLGEAVGTASVSGVVDGLGEAVGTASVSGVVSGEAETDGLGEGAAGTGVALGNTGNGARGLWMTALLGTGLGAGVGDGFAKMSLTWLQERFNAVIIYLEDPLLQLFFRGESSLERILLFTEFVIFLFLVVWRLVGLSGAC